MLEIAGNSLALVRRTFVFNDRGTFVLPGLPGEAYCRE